MPAKLTEADWIDAAQRLEVPVAAIKAVAEVEAPGAGFLPSGEPRILFERHKFSQHTRGKYDESHPDISHPKWGGYGSEGSQHDRLAKAANLDRDAALKSASWGRFQILGENWKQAGAASLQDFINAMYASERGQLLAFVAFILNDKRLHKSLKAKDWQTFARIYNGPSYAKNRYDIKLAEAYQKWSRQ